MANTQLTRIVAPNINEVDYAAKLQDVFNNINENFAKIASLPFIQGVQGDSYQLVEKPIWQKNGTGIDNVILTEDGALLLESIFKTSFSVGTTFNKVRTNLSELTISINGKDVNPIDFFKDSEGNITNNILYFYAVINDSGEEEEKQLGQYYYFVDARLKVLGDVYYGTDKSILSSFTDYTGFYQYKPETEKYDKISILPSLYYDQYKDDICWKFNGNESGVSAIGVKGMDGKDSSFQIVHVTLDKNQTISNTTSGEVDGVYRFNTLNTTTTWEKDTKDISLKVAEGNAIISIEYKDGESIYMAYGEIKFEENNGNKTAYAYWNLDTVLDKVMDYSKINSYFYNMRPGSSIPVNAPKHIAVPAITGSNDTDIIPAHTISNDINNSAALKFQYTKQGFTGPDSSQVELPSDSGDATHKAIFENYNVEIKKGDLDIPKGEIRIGTTDGLDTIKIGKTDGVGTIKIGKTSGLGTITNTGKTVSINYTPVGTDGTSCAIQLNTGGTNYKDAIASIEVRGRQWIKTTGRLKIPMKEGTVTVKPNLEVSESATIGGTLTANGKIYFKNNGNPNDPNKINSVNTIELGTQEGTNRHLDIKTDGVYIYKTNFATTDKGQAELYVDGNINTVSGGNITSDGNITAGGNGTFNNTVQISNTNCGLLLNKNSIKFQVGRFDDMLTTTYYSPGNKDTKTLDINWSILSGSDYLDLSLDGYKCIKIGKNLLVLNVQGRDNLSDKDNIVINITNTPYYALHVIGIKIINKTLSSGKYKEYKSNITIKINGGVLWTLSRIEKNTVNSVLKPFFATDGGGAFLY